MERDGFHDLVVEFDRLGRVERNALGVERVLHAHHAETDRTVPRVRALRRLGRVIIDVDDVIEHAHDHANRRLQLRVIDRAVLPQMVRDVDRRQVADGHFLHARVERDLRAEIGIVDDADMVLRRADIGRVLEGDPGMTGLEERLDHLLPEREHADLAAEDFALGGERFVGDIAFLEFRP